MARSASTTRNRGRGGTAGKRKTGTKGKTRSAGNGSAPSAGFDMEQLVDLYRWMVLTREVDQRGLKLQRQGRIGFFVPSTGQEAAHVGATAALEERDWIFPAYRDTGMFLHRGVPIWELFAQCYGNAADRIKGRQMPNHFAFKEHHLVSISSPIGTHIMHAVGAAMAAKIRGDDTVVLASFGDGGTSENDFHAGMNFAGVYGSPVVFYCQNNQWAISHPVGEQTASKTLAQKADAYGFEGVRCDGNDLLEVYETVKRAVDKARRGDGPTMIEALTYRMGAHSSSDDPTKYRDGKEVETWGKKDPLVRFRRHLEKEACWTETKEKGLWKEAADTVTAAVEKAENAGPIAIHTMFEDVYAGLTPELVREFESLKAEVEERGGIGEGHGEFPL